MPYLNQGSWKKLLIRYPWATDALVSSSVFRTINIFRLSPTFSETSPFQPPSVAEAASPTMQTGLV